jgi:hypothetical protein
MSRLRDPTRATWRLMSVRVVLTVLIGVALASGLLSACESVGSSGDDGDCLSHYDTVASASTWQGLKDAMLAYDERGRVASVRTQAKGDDVGAGDEDAVRVADLLNHNGRRLVQVDVWRTDDGAWRAGVWNQCID